MEDIINILKKSRAIITDGHFVLTSGKHTNAYLNKDALYPHTQDTSDVCKLFAEKVKNLDIDTVVGPALGGIILSTWTAYHLSKIKGKEVFGVYSEKTADGSMQFTRGYDKCVSGKKVLVVEDLTSTGGSAKKVVDAIKTIGGKAVGVCVMVNRNPKGVTSGYFGVPFFPLGTFEVQSYDQTDCPMCKAGVPINIKVGHGKQYLEEKAKLGK